MGVVHKLQSLCWLLPSSPRKNKLLRRFGHDIAESAVIGPNVVVGVGRFEVGAGVRINPFNVFKDLSLVRMDADSLIASWNWISAAPEFQQVDPRAGTLHMERGAKVGSRNYLDASGTIIVKEYGWVGGNRAFLQTHEPDLQELVQSAGRIVIGHHSLVHSCTVLLKGAELPDQSVLETHSTLLASSTRDGRRGVYAGSPATWQGDTTGEWFERTESVLSQHRVDIAEPTAVPTDATR